MHCAYVITGPFCCVSLLLALQKVICLLHSYGTFVVSYKNQRRNLLIIMHFMHQHFMHQHFMHRYLPVPDNLSYAGRSAPDPSEGNALPDLPEFPDKVLSHD